MDEADASPVLALPGRVVVAVLLVNSTGGSERGGVKYEIAVCFLLVVPGMAEEL